MTDHQIPQGKVDEVSLDELDIDNDGLADDITSPAVGGESSVSGSTSDPSADDDLLANAHEAGLYEGDDSENPQELDIAGEVEKAEHLRRTAPISSDAS